jgi:hypothetical protein
MTLGRIVLLALSTIALGVVIVDLTGKAEENTVSVSPKRSVAAGQADHSSTGTVGWANWHTGTQETPLVAEPAEVPPAMEPASTDGTNDAEREFNERFKGMEFARKPGQPREGGR